MGLKPSPRQEFFEINYDDDQWRLLHNLRVKALELMNTLELRNIVSILYGSIARGDVNGNSDIDVFITSPSSSMEVELALDNSNIIPTRRILVQATPNYAPKGYYEIEENVSVSMPLVKLRRNEREFYKFAGEIVLEDAKLNKRVPGVNKHLMLIEPRKSGHTETSIIENEACASKLLGINIEIAFERVRILLRRSKHGRTGRFIELELKSDENFESVLKRYATKYPSLRKRLEN